MPHPDRGWSPPCAFEKGVGWGVLVLYVSLRRIQYIVYLRYYEFNCHYIVDLL